jgi:hypothetical protein
MAFLLIMIAVLILSGFAAVANELGVDSRDLSDDPHRSAYPIGIA